MKACGVCFSYPFDAPTETRLEDFYSSPLGTMPSDTLAAFEAAHGHFEALHEVDRTRSAVLMERYG